MKALLLIVMTAMVATREARADAIASKTATVDGIKIHYFTEGTGEPLLLIHGYAQNAHMWKAVMPELAKKYTVIAPDLPGFGESGIPADGLDMKTAATRIHDLMKQLNVTKARVVGHDIGLMVAYAYAAMYSSETQKLVLMDAFLPGIGDWLVYYHNPQLWHFFFSGPTPEQLVKGRERTYFLHFWDGFAGDPNAHMIGEADRKVYLASYAQDGRMRAGWAYFQNFPNTAKDFEQLGKTKLKMPVLVIAGEKSANEFLGNQVKLVATDVTAKVIKGIGHWVIDENRAAVLAAMEAFL
ncbi:MAG TPA: alpha/beta hydrolase [Kofleriaceae bacterium]